jgi:hypothetical protein
VLPRGILPVYTPHLHSLGPEKRRHIALWVSESDQTCSCAAQPTPVRSSASQAILGRQPHLLDACRSLRSLYIPCLLCRSELSLAGLTHLPGRGNRR